MVEVKRAAVLAAAIGILFVACDEPADTNEQHGADTTQSPSQPTAGGATDAGAGGDDTLIVPIQVQDAGPPPPPAPPEKCSLAALAPAVLTPSYMQVDPKNGVNTPVAKGGSPEGNLIFDKAVVWFPASLKGLVKPATSTGTIKAWAAFRGDEHNFAIDVDLKIDSRKGIQSQTNVTASHGTFAVEGTLIKIKSSCDPGATIPTTDVAVDDNGDRVTLLMRIPTNRGDVYISLEAPRGH
jgi:hypothetical protein